jgi:glycosyltransferase involved in cell wall biosynthesis
MGGSTEAARQLTNGLSQLGHEVDILTLIEPREIWLSLWKASKVVSCTAYSHYRISPGLHHWVREHAKGYDVVVVNGVWRYLGVGVWWGLKNTGVPYVVIVHGMMSPWFRGAFPAKHMRKVLAWKVVESRILRDALMVVFSTEREHEEARETFFPLICRTAIVSNGLAAPSLSWLADATRMRSSEETERILLFLGRLHPVKGCDVLVDAFARVHSLDERLRLVIAGPDECGLRSELQRRCVVAGVSDIVRWVGAVGDEEKWRLLMRSEALVLASHSDSFGMSAVEALACGRPVLMTDKVNIAADIVKAGAGLMGADTVEGVYDVLRRWVMMPAAARVEMSARAYLCFMERYQSGRVAAQFVQCVRDTAGLS